MERYHSFKLGLAILFYAVYCIRPMIVNCEESDNRLESNNKNSNDVTPTPNYWLYFQGIEGKPGVDFPVFSYIPRTGFDCREMESGYYADMETNCQVFHICEEGKKISFLCPNGTIFQQEELICEWWNKVNCTNAPNLYHSSAERLQNDIARRKSSRRVLLTGGETKHGAVMRTEEEASITATRNGEQYSVKDKSTVKEIRKNNNRHFEDSAKTQTINKNYINTQLKRDNSATVSSTTASETGTTLNVLNAFGSNKEYHVQFETNSYNQLKTDNKFVTSTKDYSNVIDTSTNIPEYYIIRKNNRDFIESGTNPTVTNQSLLPTKSSALPNSIERDHEKIRGTYDSSTISTVPKEAEISNNVVNSGSIHTVLNPSNQSRGNIKYGSNLHVQETATSNNRHLEIVPAKEHPQGFPIHNKENGSLSVVINNNNITSAAEDEMQITQETASFVKNKQNFIEVENARKFTLAPNNHKTTYSDLTIPNYSSSKISSISSITPQFVTTQSINNGKPFVGSRVGTTYYATPSTTEKTGSTALNLTPFGPYAPSTTQTSAPITSSEINNAPASTEQSFIVPSTTLQPVKEEPFVKKYVAPLFSTENPVKEVVTEKVIDHATVYGSFVKSTTSSPVLNAGLPIIFNKNSDKIEIKLSKSFGGDRSTLKPYYVTSKFYKDNDNDHIKFGSTVQPPFLDINANVHYRNGLPIISKTTVVPNQVSGFYVTKGFPISSSVPTSSVINAYQKPRPFQKSTDFDEVLQTNEFTNSLGTTRYPPYQISSARPFTKESVASYSPTVPTVQASSTLSSIPQNDVLNNIDNMLHVLMEIANVQPEDSSYERSRPGLVVPPSVGPETLHSLAQYFANGLDGNGTQELESIAPDMKEKLTTLLTQMTVHGYNTLFKFRNKTQENVEASTNSPLTSTMIVSRSFDVDVTTPTTPANIDDSNETAPPELRLLARNFSLALSSYLNDPEVFRKDLENFRPTAPPLTEAQDAEASGIVNDATANDEELLNFSDADIKSSLAPFQTTTTSVKPTWGYIIAANPISSDTDSNSLNPDLNTADSQSFVPKFNNVYVNENKNTKDVISKSTELPIDHWTTSRGVTKLWSKAFSVDPASVNDHFETTTLVPIVASGEEQNDEINCDESETLTAIDSLPKLSEPNSEINYEVRSLKPLDLNSTQVHGLLIDFVNSTKTDHTNRLQRLLKKLNTSEDEFLKRMQVIEENPLTKRLVLLLISECGANVSKDLEEISVKSLSSEITSEVTTLPTKREEKNNLSNNFARLIDPNLSDNSQDTRALQLLNSLYSIASKFGK